MFMLDNYSIAIVSVGAKLAMPAKKEIYIKNE